MNIYSRYDLYEVMSIPPRSIRDKYKPNEEDKPNESHHDYPANVMRLELISVHDRKQEKIVVFNDAAENSLQKTKASNEWYIDNYTKHTKNCSNSSLLRQSYTVESKTSEWSIQTGYSQNILML